MVRICVSRRKAVGALHFHRALREADAWGVFTAVIVELSLPDQPGQGIRRVARVSGRIRERHQVIPSTERIEVGEEFVAYSPAVYCCS